MSTRQPIAADPMREAWTRIAEGFEHALQVEGITGGERARMIRCLRRARFLAGQRHLQPIRREGEGGTA